MDCRFLYSKIDKKIFIKLVGDVKYNYSNNFNNFIDTIFNKNFAEDIIIDLSSTNYIDSTNLGLLAKIARFQNKQNSKKVTIISTQKNITELLESMGFDMVFILIKTTVNESRNYLDVDNIGNLDDRATAKLMLEAHRELAELNDANKATFKDVVNFLSNELGEK